MSFGKPQREELTPTGPASITPISSSATSGKPDAYLGRGSKITGNLVFSGPVEIDGAVDGEVHAKDTLIIGETAVVNAKIEGGEIVIRGTVTGDVKASKKLSLKKPAKVTGNIFCSTLSIEEGVAFEGKCSMVPNGAAPNSSADSGIKPVSAK